MIISIKKETLGRIVDISIGGLRIFTGYNKWKPIWLPRKFRTKLNYYFYYTWLGLDICMRRKCNRCKMHLRNNWETDYAILQRGKVTCGSCLYKDGLIDKPIPFGVPILH